MSDDWNYEGPFYVAEDDCGRVLAVAIGEMSPCYQWAIYGRTDDGDNLEIKEQAFWVPTAITAAREGLQKLMDMGGDWIHINQCPARLGEKDVPYLEKEIGGQPIEDEKFDQWLKPALPKEARGMFKGADNIKVDFKNWDGKLRFYYHASLHRNCPQDGEPNFFKGKGRRNSKEHPTSITPSKYHLIFDSDKGVVKVIKGPGILDQVLGMVELDGPGDQGHDEASLIDAIEELISEDFQASISTMTELFVKHWIFDTYPTDRKGNPVSRSKK